MSKAEKFIKDCTRNCSNELCAVEDRFEKKVYHMSDKAKIRAEIERRYRENKADGYSDVCEELWDMLSFIDSMQEEPVSENLEEAVNAYIGYAPEVDESSSTYGKRQAFKAGAQWQKEKDQSHLVHEHIDPPTFEEAQGEKKKED